MRRSHTRGALAAAALVALIGAGGVGAQAAPEAGWSPVRQPRVVPERTFETGSPVLGAAGRAILPATVSTPEGARPGAVERLGDGRRWRVRVVGPPTRSPSPVAFMNRRGDAMVVWQDPTRLVSSARTAGGGWTAPQPIGPEPGTTTPTLRPVSYVGGLDDRGVGRLVGVACELATCRTQTLVSPAPGAPWQPAGGEAGLPGLVDGQAAIAIGARGDAALVWIRKPGQVLAVVRRPDTPAWEAPVGLNDAAGEPGAGLPGIIVGPSGDALAWWQPGALDARGLPTVIIGARGLHAATLGPSFVESWTSPQVIVPQDHDPALRPTFALDARGSAFAAWTRMTPEYDAVLTVSRKSRTGSWESGTEVQRKESDGFTAGPIGTAFLTRGYAFVASSITGHAGFERAVGFVSDRPGARWRRATPAFGLRGSPPPLAAGRDGRYLVAYGLRSRSTLRVQELGAPRRPTARRKESGVPRP